jgi:hypothetical protein
MTRREQFNLASALLRQMPVKGCHQGRGRGHHEGCFTNCFDSWQRCVNETAWAIEQTTPKFDRDNWIRYVYGQTSSADQSSASQRC